MAHRALVYKSDGGQNLTNGHWALLMRVLYTDTAGVVEAVDRQVNIELDPAAPLTFAPTVDAAIIATGAEAGFTVTSADIFSPVFA